MTDVKVSFTLTTQLERILKSYKLSVKEERAVGRFYRANFNLSFSRLANRFAD